MLAEICHNGYMDALRFLIQNEYLSPSLVAEINNTPKPACCELKESAEAADESDQNPNLKRPQEEEHCWLDRRLIRNLPVSMKKVLCEACRDRQVGGGGLLSRVTDLLP